MLVNRMEVYVAVYKDEEDTLYKLNTFRMVSGIKVKCLVHEIMVDELMLLK